MANENNLFSLEDFLAANQAKKLGSLDYLHAIFKLAGLPIDLVFCFIKLLAPKFKVVNGLVFLSETFDVDIYNRYISDGESEIQLWINLVEVTGVFEEIEEHDAIRLADEIVKIWNLKLVSDDIHGIGRARVIHNKEDGEVFVTIDNIKVK